MAYTQSATTESETTCDETSSMMSFIAMLKANRDVLSHLPEIIEQWHKKETTTTDQSGTTDQPETTKQGYVRAR